MKRPLSLALLALLLGSPLAHAQAPLRTLTSPDPEPQGFFGLDVSGVGDLDGDGRGDLLVGAYAENGGAQDAGRAYAFSGATGALVHALTSPAAEAQGNFGISVAGVPDTDGDGAGDLLVGASGEDVVDMGALVLNAGRAYLFDGATGALLDEKVPGGPDPDGRFGLSVGGLPDVNGDGRGDYLIGTPYGDRSDTDRAGHVGVYEGAGGALLQGVYGTDDLGGFGVAVSAVPDADGDGLADVLVGASIQDPGGVTDAGRAYLYRGSLGAAPLLHTLVSPSPETDGNFGSAVEGVADVNGDGRGDLLVGAYREDGGAADAGRVYVFDGASGAHLRTLTSPNVEAGGRFGYAVAGINDVDGDGRGDLIVGAPAENGGATDAGRAYVFSGASGALLRTLTSPAGEAGCFFLGSFGWSVSAAPDASGDGLPDVLVGSPCEDGGADGAGRVYLFGGAVATAVEPAPGATAFSLASTPNPSSGATALTFTLPASGRTRLAVYDALGREVAVLVDAAMEAGHHEAVLNGGALPAGVYLVRMTAGAFVRTQRVTLIR